MRDFAGDYVGAALELERRQEGEAPGALWHPEVGPISLAWGHSGDSRGKGFGLAKLIDHHPEVIADLPERLAGMKVKNRNRPKQQITLESKTTKAVVQLEYKGTSGAWLLTAYDTEDRATKPERGKRGRKARRPQATFGTLRDLFGAAGVTLPARRSANNDKNGSSYQQNKGATARGSITFGERTTIRLFEKANLSTVLHESGHLFRELAEAPVTGEGGDEQVTVPPALSEQTQA
ncbi:MAG: hypothetical protein R3D03_22295 [Geminicoccaceae bacterium]